MDGDDRAFHLLVWNCSSFQGVNLAASVQGGGIYTSSNSGLSWTLTIAPSTNWSAIASSADGSQLVAAVNGGLYYGGGRIFSSTNFGSTWTPTIAPSNYWVAVYSSASGSNLVALANGGGFTGGPIYFSTNSGSTWAAANAPKTNWSAIASSADGHTLVATVNGGSIYTSINSGATWTASGATSQYWSAIASSADGTHLVAATANGGIFTSSNSGTSWATNTVPKQNWSALDSSPDGSTLIAFARSGWSYQSTDGGATWTELTTPYDFWQCVASSASGSNLLAAAQYGYLYRSTNAGANWQELNSGVKTNVIISDVLTINAFTTNVNDHNVYISQTSFTLLATNSTPTNNINFTTTLGINIIGTNMTGLNSTMVIGDLGLSAGATAFAFSPLGTLSLGTNVLGTGALIPTGGNTNVTVSNFTIPQAPDLTTFLITNPIELLNTNFSSVCSASVSNVDVVVSNSAQVNVEIVNVLRQWAAVASSADGTKLLAAVNGGKIYFSTNSGVWWSATTAPSTNWTALAYSDDGTTMLALTGSGSVYTSLNSGLTWVGTNVVHTNYVYGTNTITYIGGAVASSANGSELVAAPYGGFIYDDPPTLPMLGISAAGGQVVITWPTGIDGLVLQGNCTNSQASWNDLPATAIVTNEENKVTLPVTNAFIWYRLRK